MHKATQKASPDAPAVEVQALERRFGSFIAVNHISFSVERGRIFGFLGPNGAGKSTTIRMLCGILAPSGGSGQVAGLDIRTQAEAIKSRIGYMSQKFSLYEDLTVEENINFFSGIYNVHPSKKQPRKEWVLTMAGLERHRKALAGSLSGGWKQRLALGCAVLHEPPIVFLDEPTSGVDPISRRRFWELIYAMSDQGVTVFVTTHYMDEAEYCDELVLIYQGTIIASGTPRDLKTQFMRDDIIDLRCDNPQDAIELLDDVTGVREAALFGNGLHIAAEDGQAALPLVIQRLETNGFTIRKAEVILPSLEDVFVSLVEAYDRQNATEKGTRP